MPTANFNRYFPDYEILSELGRANARVLKARHRQTQEIVAIKHYAFNADDETLARFQEESKIMKLVNDLNVVKITDVQLTAELPYIAMEFVEGGDVRSLLKKQSSLNVSTVIRLGLQMADALDAIHKLTIIHRDIKPDNIMYQVMSSGELHFLLTDFGISKIRGSDSVTITGQSPMTLEYASPEQFEDTHNITTATDYYSLGVVLYECLTGKVPFAVGTRGFGSFAKIVENEVPPPINLPKAAYLPKKLRAVVNGLLEKDPAQRLTNLPKLRKWLKEADVETEAYEEPLTPPPVVNKETKIRPVLEVPIKGINTGEKKQGTKEFFSFNKSQFLAGVIIMSLLGIGGVWYGISKYSPTTIKNNSPVDSTQVKKERLYSYIGIYQGGLALTLKKGSKQYGFIDERGQEVIPFIYDEASSFSEGLAPVRKDFKAGFIDKTGKEVIALEYDETYPFSEGLAPVWKDGKAGFIDKTGKEVIPLIYDYLWHFSERLAQVWKKGKGRFIDKTGKEVIALEYDGAKSFSEGLAPVRKDGKAGFIDKTGKEVIALEYDETYPFSEGLARVRKDFKEGFIDKTGKEVIALEYDGVESFSEGLARVRKDFKEGFIGKTGKEVIALEYNGVDSFSEGLAFVWKKGSTGFIDKTGKEVIALEYDGAGSFSEGLAPVWKDGSTGFIDKTGKEVIPLIYSVINSFSKGLAPVWKEAKKGVIDRTGQFYPD